MAARGCCGAPEWAAVCAHLFDTHSPGGFPAGRVPSARCEPGVPLRAPWAPLPGPAAPDAALPDGDMGFPQSRRLAAGAGGLCLASSWLPPEVRLASLGAGEEHRENTAGRVGITGQTGVPWEPPSAACDPLYPPRQRGC